MQNTAHPAAVALLEQAETFRCVECSRSLPASMLAFDTDAARGEGVCLTCDAEYAGADEPEQYTGGGDVWPLGIVSAAANDGRYSLMGREVL